MKKLFLFVIITGILLAIGGAVFSMYKLLGIYDEPFRCPEQSSCPEADVNIANAERGMYQGFFLSGAGIVVIVSGAILFRKAERKIEDAKIKRNKQVY